MTLVVANTQWHHLNLCTDKFSKEGWSGAGWPVDEEEVDWCTRQCHTNSHQRIDSITVEGNHYQEHTAYAVDNWEKQRQLQESQEGGGLNLEQLHLEINIRLNQILNDPIVVIMAINCSTSKHCSQFYSMTIK